MMHRPMALTDLQTVSRADCALQIGMGLRERCFERKVARKPGSNGG
ncbi:phosphomethylpyrimidine kinase domain protein [Brucella abortus]|nr:phosphomethylpyrimidine kinase domain protein [Brucella abortus]